MIRFFAPSIVSQQIIREFKYSLATGQEVKPRLLLLQGNNIKDRKEKKEKTF
jgi:hypothetical protein